MASNSYYAPHPHTTEKHQQQHLLSPALSSPGFSSGLSSGESSPLKPVHHVGHTGHAYNARQSTIHFEEAKNAQIQDERLKAHIRHLRLISRIVALLISIAVLVPIALTLHKFLSTQNVYHSVRRADGKTVSRTAWAKDTKAWPTWMYFLVAAVAVALNLVIVLSHYLCGVAHANRASTVASAFGWAVMLGNLVVWSVAASLYRSEKDRNGKSNDLWGWTCSPGARAIQKEFAGEVDFNRFCNVQSISWYIGLVQVGAAALSVVIYVLVFMRRRSKKEVKRRTRVFSEYEAARH